MKDKKKIFKTRVLPIGLIVLNVIVFAVEQVVAGFFNTEWYETLILIGVGLLFTFFAWFIVAWFVREIVQALEELPEEEVQKIQKQAGNRANIRIWHTSFAFNNTRLFLDFLYFFFR